MTRWLALAFALFLAAPAWAADELRQQQLVEAAVNRLAQEQQAVYQQFQMVQDLRRNEERLSLQRMPIYRLAAPGAAASFDDLQREEATRQQRVDALQYEADRLYARYRELEEQKRPLLDTLGSLALAPPVAAAAPPAPALPAPAPARPLALPQ